MKQTCISLTVLKELSEYEDLCALLQLNRIAELFAYDVSKIAVYRLNNVAYKSDTYYIIEYIKYGYISLGSRIVWTTSTILHITDIRETDVYDFMMYSFAYINIIEQRK